MPWTHHWNRRFASTPMGTIWTMGPMLGFSYLPRILSRDSKSSSKQHVFRQGNNLNLDGLGNWMISASTSHKNKYQLIVRAYGEANDDGVDEFLEPIPHHIHLHVHELHGTSARHSWLWTANKQQHLRAGCCISKGLSGKSAPTAWKYALLMLLVKATDLSTAVFKSCCRSSCRLFNTSACTKSLALLASPLAVRVLFLI